MEKNIAVLSGDGIGPEVIEQALKVLSAIEKNLIIRSILNLLWLAP